MKSAHNLNGCRDGLDELQAAYLQRMAANNPAAEPPVSTPEGPSIEALAEAPPLAGIRSSSQTTVSAIQRLASTSSSAYFAKVSLSYNGILFLWRVFIARGYFSALDHLSFLEV